MNTNYERNIKVTMNEVYEGVERRSSTTLSYVVCNYYFAEILYPKEAAKSLDKRYKDPQSRYRKWLEKTVTDWAKTQPQARSDALERTLLELIYDKAYKSALDKNRDNHALDL